MFSKLFSSKMATDFREGIVEVIDKIINVVFTTTIVFVTVVILISQTTVYNNGTHLINILPK